MNRTILRRGFEWCIFATTLCVAFHALGQDIASPEIPVDSWFAGPARQDFPWRVQLSQSELTYQQRHYVRAGVAFRIGDLIKAGVSLDDLHVIIRVSDENGQWLPGESYGRFPVSRDLAASDAVQSVTHMFVRAGNYKVAAMIYDSAHRRGNLWKGELHVGLPKGDPLPGIEQDLPAVQFLSRSTPLPLADDLVPQPNPYPWSLGSGTLRIPVANVRPVLIDIVANFSIDLDPSNEAYQASALSLLQIGNVLAQLNPKAGCVRASAVDVHQQAIFLDRQDAKFVDWALIQQAIGNIDQAKVDASALGREKQAPAFFADYLERLSDATTGCQGAGPSPLHIVIVFGHSMRFADGTQMTTVRPELKAGVVLYNLRDAPLPVPGYEQLSSVMKPWQPVKVDFSSPIQFRRALAQLIASIEAASGGTAANKH